MNKTFDKAYDVFSKDQSKWMILGGIACYALFVFIGFIAGIIGMPSETLYYIFLFLFKAAILAGIGYGYYLKKEPVLIFSLVAFLIVLFYDNTVGNAQGIRFLQNADASWIVYWIFGFVFGLAIGVFTISALLLYFFRKKKAALVFKISFFAVLFFGIATWVCGIIAAACGNGWSLGVLPLFEACSLIMVPGLFEEIRPGETEITREEVEEEKAE